MRAAGREPGILDRFLRLFTDVRSGEGLTAVLLMLNVFLILGAYYLIKPVREALILAERSAEVKSYVSAGQAMLLVGLVPLYGALASRVPRKTLINAVTLFFTACLGAFFVLVRTDLPTGIAFFLWVGIFNLMIVAQFWAFANDVYTKEEGERLFPIVAFGASAGAVAGSVAAGRIIDVVGVSGALMAGGIVLVASLALTNWIDAREGVASGGGSGSPNPVAEGEVATDGEVGDEEAAGSPGRAGPLGGEKAFRLLFENRYLLLIAALILVMNWVNTTGEYILSRTVEAAARETVAGGQEAVERFIGTFYSDFFAVVNVAGLVIQAFLVSRIIKYIGIRWAIMVLPVLAFGAYALLAFIPVLSVVRWAKTAENATDYSLQNTVRHALFLPTTREEKYKAKQAIDTVFWRAGDVLSAGVVFVGARLLALRTGHFAVVNLGLIAAWLVVAFVIGRRYRAMAPEDALEAIP